MEGLKGLVVEDISSQTIPRDFERKAKIHSCWKISAGK
jgi:23S rRNA (guanine2445-N2)-methyltransferase / 23S rRNA (guanine2069-N7)-methyltransferase